MQVFSDIPRAPKKRTEIVIWKPFLWVKCAKHIRGGSEGSLQYNSHDIYIRVGVVCSSKAGHASAKAVSIEYDVHLASGILVLDPF